MAKLVVCIMGQNCEKFIGMCLESVKDADAIVYCSGSELDPTHHILTNKYNFSAGYGNCNPIKTIDEDGKVYTKIIIHNEYNQEDKQMNGKQRNFYLNYLKENYSMGTSTNPNWWALCLDADEVVDDLSKIKEFINTIQEEAEDILFSIKMRHFIGDLGNEDATQSSHFVPHRLFKIRENLIYPEVEHPILQVKDLVKDEKKIEFRSANIIPTTIWHLAYIPNLFEYKKKYENHLKKSDMHSKQFLDGWYRAHLFGQYPKSQIDLIDIPKVIFNEFGIDKDELYFANRGLEVKHFIMCKDWVDYFKPEYILDLGSGVGHYGKVFKFFNKDIHYLGIDKSKWAIENTPYKDLTLECYDITKLKLNTCTHDAKWDLIMCVDILEHLKYEDLDELLKEISNNGKNFIFSIPYLDDPNLEADKTHVIKESKEWWVEKLSQYFKIKDAPKEWLFSNQLLVGERK